ncbi:MAG: zinc metalloprotease HtpX [Acidimicrobiia bacterium]|nr:MAG: zinc metalloprotease HtpX [Acidimicrobiia bacterium]
MRNNFKTVVLMATLGALFVGVGQLIGGTGGATTALVIAGLMNFAMYFFSDKIALAGARAKAVEEHELPQVYQIVRSLAQRQDLPMPKIYLIDSPQPNAFATGRNPSHAAVAVTTGIVALMDHAELEGVLAHELSHVRNRDILIASVAATVAVALSFLVRIAFWTGMGNDRRENNPVSAVVGILAIILAPLAAMVIQMAISRSREYEADRSGAEMTGSPLTLARALARLEEGTSRIPMQVDPSTAQLFIADPLKAFGRRGSGGMGGMTRMFSTHPPIAERIARLEEMAQGGLIR